MNGLHREGFNKNQLFLIVTATVFMLSILPVTRTLYQLRVSQQALDNVTNQTNHHRSLLARVEEHERNWQYQQRSTSDMELKIPSTESLPSLINELNQIADTCEIRITGLFTASGSTIAEGAKQTNLELNLSGSYKEVKHYLSHLPTIDRYLSIKTVEMTRIQQHQSVLPLNDNNNGELWHAIIKFNVFFWPIAQPMI